MIDLEWRGTVGQINADVRGIIRAQQVLEDVHRQLSRRAAKPIEEDYIFADAFGHSPPNPRTIKIDGVEIEVRTLHRRGLHQVDIKGADLLYEIVGRKFALIQYKTPDSSGRVRRDAQQLKELVEACPNPCPPSGPWLWPTCGSWYAIRATRESLYLPACVAEEMFGTAKSRHVRRFTHRFSAEEFQQLFGQCWTGARTTPAEFFELTWPSLERDHILFSVVQKGSFGQ